MSIRSKLLRSYLAFVVILFVFSIALFFVIQLTNQNYSRLLDLYSFQYESEQLFDFMGNKGLHWAYGRTLEDFRYQINSLDNHLEKIKKEIHDSRYYTDNIKRELVSLQNVWNRIYEEINSLIDKVDHPKYYPILEKLSFSRDLQRLNTFWIDSYFNRENMDREGELVIRRFLTGIDSIITIHSKAINGHNRLLINKLNSFNRNLERIIAISFSIIITVFICGLIFIAFRFTNQISIPIINSTEYLRKFAGISITDDKNPNEDELEYLKKSIRNITDYYSELASSIHNLACGNLDYEIPIRSNSDVIGNSLNDLIIYLKQLLEVSNRISSGEYLIDVHPQSNYDKLTINFNYMSRVISEKITTLQSVFDTVEESIVVLDENLEALEANQKFLDLVNAGNLDEFNENSGFLRLLWDETEFLRNCFADIEQRSQSTNIQNLDGVEIPVSISVKKILPGPDNICRIMMTIVNETVENRYEREFEKLKAETTLSELKALRAQINPHFLFNTLNTILYFAETKPSQENVVSLVEKLSDIFRYTLNATKRGLVTLDEELEHIMKYIEIEKYRFGDRLKVNLDIDSSIGSQMLPPMLLQPIIENAIKYSEDKYGNITVYVGGKHFDNSIELTICDRGIKPIQIESLLLTDGTGLKNVDMRLRTLFGQGLHLEKNFPTGLSVSMRIPTK